jgi:hypothetical protein
MRKTLVLFFSLVPLVLASCQKKGEGEVCSDDDECASGLTCDKHGRPTGKCLKPHHGEPGAGADAATADTRPVDAPSTVDAGPGADAATAGTGPDSQPADSQPADTAADASAPPSPDAAAPDAAMGNQACEAYCTCMEQSCRTLAYPWADRAACLTACGRFSATERTCFANFCTQASMMGQAAREHSCEHAAGALGAAECP